MGTDTTTHDRTDYEQHRLEKVASRSVRGGLALGLTLPPVAYWYVGRPATAVLNLLTINWFLLGFVFTPWHIKRIIRNARRDLGRHPRTNRPLDD